jgi:DNA-binding transcriptional ArsR family regulator
MDERDSRDTLLAALRHPVRREMLERVVGQDGAISPRQIAEQLGMPLSNVSYHVRVLVEFKMLQLVETRPKRGSIQHFYEASDLVEHPVVKASLGFGDAAAGEVRS